MNGELLRRLREAAGIKQSDLADAADMHNSALSTYESGRREMPAWIAEKLLKTIDEMLADRTDEFTRLRGEAEAARDGQGEGQEPETDDKEAA